jgi:signal transduction histidine kinase
VIRAVIAGGKRFGPQETIRLAPGTDHVDVEFTALSYTVPERTVFRYRLAGVEQDWQGPSDRRYASYANLKPGTYTFELQAALHGGAWSPQTARIGVEIRPYFTQTRWFLALCALALAGMAALLYRWRLREVTARLHLLLRERQRIARTLHDTFLQSLQALVWRFEQIGDSLPAHHPDRHLLDLTLAQANEVMTEGRHQIVGLRPGADASTALEARVAAMLESFRLRFSKTIALDVVNPDGARLVPIVADEAFHIAHEAVSNALNHSDGKRVGVELHYTAGAFVLRVSDDGRGIEAAVLARGGRDGHWGLTGMRERARVVKGLLRVESDAAGTIVTLRVPRAAAYERSRRR